MKLKYRLVVHENKVIDNNDVRKYSSSSQLPVIRAVSPAASIKQLRLATIDISGAYLQSRPPKRHVYVHVLRGCTSSRFTVWKLLKMSHGLTESDRI